MKAGRWVATAVLFVTLARGAAGQVAAGLGPTIVGSSSDKTGWQTASLLSSSLRLDEPHATLALDDALARDASGRVFTSGSLISNLSSSSYAGIRFDVRAHRSRNQVTSALSDDQALTATLSYTSGNTSAWSGLSTATWMNPGIIFGASHQLGLLTLSFTSAIRSGRMGGRAANLRVLTSVDTILTDTGWVTLTHRSTVGDSGAPARQRSWAESQGRVSYSRGRFAFDGVVGWRPKLDTISRAVGFQAFATVRLSRALALSLGAGTTNTAAPYLRSTGHFATIGVRVAPAFTLRPSDPSPAVPCPSTFDVRKTEAGDYLIQLRVPHARVVELSGDFDDWKPIRLVQVETDVWEATLVLRPGTYHMNIRVDGARWEPPPDVTAVEDDFNGRSGIVVIR